MTSTGRQYRVTSTPPPERRIALDALRGVAICGIFFVNLPAFAGPVERAYDLAPAEPWHAVLAWSIQHGLCETKFVSLFALMFGIGFALQRERAARSGASFARLQRRRLLSLGALGLLHGVLLFFGDILFVYAAAGTLLFACRRASPGAKLVTAGCLATIGVVLSLLTLSGQIGSDHTVGPWAVDERIALSDLRLVESGELPWSAFEHKAYATGPYASTLLVNTVSFVGWLVVSSLFSFNWRVLALFFLGAALVEARALERSVIARRCAAFGLPIGLVLEGLATARGIAHAGGGWSAGAVLAHEVGALALAAGYYGAVLTLAGRGGPIARAFAAAGRLALTNYLLQSIAGNVLFRWYGFGLWGELSRVTLLGIAIAVTLMQVAGSVLWLRRFRSGPLEGLWRRVTYGGRAS